MPKINLTDAKLRSLKPAEAGKRYDVMDSEIRGLGVRVNDKGDRTFIFYSRFPGTASPQRRSLGEYPAMSLAAARKRAADWREQIRQGIDPRVQEEAEQAARRREEEGRNRKTFEAVLERFIAARRRDGIRKADQDERDFKRLCLPQWQGKPVDEITMADILAVLEPIRDRGTVRMAQNLAQKIGTFLNWCVDDELMPASPYRAKRIKIALGEKKSKIRVLTPEEIRAFWAAIHELDDTYTRIYLLLLYTGQRLREILELSWSEINFERRTLTISKERFKSDRDHVLPLTDRVYSIIESTPRWGSCPWVFSLNGRNPVTIGTKVKNRVHNKMERFLQATTCVECPKIAPWTNHDLRRTLRTYLTELDVMDEVAEAVIGHKAPQLNRVYNHSQRLKMKHDALVRWENAVDAMVRGKSESNVVALADRMEAAS